MDEPQSLDGELSQAIFTRMLRDGVLPAATVEAVMLEFQQQAETARSRYHEDRASTLSRMALEILMAGSGEPAEDPQVLFRRDQIRKRTAYIERNRDLDGGKPDT